MSAIELTHLRRVFRSYVGVIRHTAKEVLAVEDISFLVHDGELFGLLGPNGAGRTTTIKMLTTLLIPTSGRATIGGLDVVKQAGEVRKRIGFIFGGPAGGRWCTEPAVGSAPPFTERKRAPTSGSPPAMDTYQ